MRGKTRAKQFEDRNKYDRPLIPNIPDSIIVSFYMFGMIPCHHRKLGTFRKIEHSRFSPFVSNNPRQLGIFTILHKFLQVGKDRETVNFLIAWEFPDMFELAPSIK